MFIIVLFEKVKAIFTNEAETLKSIYSKKKKNTYLIIHMTQIISNFTHGFLSK